MTAATPVSVGRAGSESPLRLLWGYCAWIAIFVVAASGLTYWVSSSRPSRYVAGAQVLVVSGAQSSGNYIDPTQLQHLTDLEDQLARTRAVAEAAVPALPPGTTVRTVQHHVSISVDAFLQQITIKGHGASPDEAVRYANAYAHAFVGFVNQTATDERAASLAPIQSEVTQLEKQLGSDPPANEATSVLTFKLQTLQTKLVDLASAPLDTVRIIQPAIPPTVAASPRPKRDTALAFVGALALAVGAVFGRLLLSDHFQSSDEASAVLGLPVLAELPRTRRGSAARDEAFRKLRAGVQFAVRRIEHPVLAITGSSPETGKTFVSVNLAWAFAAEGLWAVVVDADLRRPRVHERLGVPRVPGLTEVLLGDDVGGPLPVSIDLPSPLDARGGQLAVVPAGAPVADAAELLSGSRLRPFLQETRQSFDAVLVDTPPLAVVDPIAVGRFADAILLVIDARRDKRRDLRRAVQTLHALELPIIGIVFNNSKAAVARYQEYSPFVIDEASGLGRRGKGGSAQRHEREEPNQPAGGPEIATADKDLRLGANGHERGDVYQPAHEARQPTADARSTGDEPYPD